MPWLRRFPGNPHWYVAWREPGGRRAASHTRKISRKKGIAIEFMRRLQERLDRERAGLPLGNLTPRDFWRFHRWRLQARVRAGDLSPATLRRTREGWRHFLGWLRRHRPEVRRLADLSQATFRDYQLHRARRVRSKTVNTEINMLSPAFRAAVQEGRLASNPMAGLPRLKERDSRPAAVISPEQAGALLEAASEGFRPYLLGYLYTGARRGELQAVRWADVDLEAGTLTLQNLKTHSQAADRTRLVPLHRELLEFLRTTQMSGERPWPPVPNQSLRRWFLQTARAAGLPHLTRLHDLRHAFAGALVSQGVDLYVVGQLLGHRDPSTTKRYAHLQPEALRRAVHKLKF